jgi:rubrerythrin
MSTATFEETDREFFDDVRELVCRECGYGVVVRRDPPECPMCRSNAWSMRPSLARWN